MIKLIVIGSNRHALVDDDHAQLARYRWRLDVVEQISGDQLNCTRANLRLVLRAVKDQNQPPRASSKTGVRGVSFDAARGQFAATVCHAGKRHRLGHFATLEEADAAARKGRAEILPLSVETSAP